MRRRSTVLKGRCLDRVETASRNRLRPLMFCHIDFDAPVDIVRLRTALSWLCEDLPALRCAYSRKRGGWIERGSTVEDLTVPDADLDGNLGWDPQSEPQIKVYLGPDRRRLVVGLSHILSDGGGFLQLLYRLSAHYGGERLDPAPRNERDLRYILRQVAPPAKPPRRSTADGATPPLPLPCGEADELAFCLISELDAECIAGVRARARSMGCTLNDVLMTAYARVIAGRLGKTVVTLPCPADLRRFAPQPDGLSVANLTGMFRLTAEVHPVESFSQALLRVHQGMRAQREARSCFHSLRLLRALEWLPPGMLDRFIRGKHQILPVSYSNLGAIDVSRMHFNGLALRRCFMTGAYRVAPDFQLTVSGFDGGCTLCCTLVGGAEKRRAAQTLLDDVADDLRRWGSSATAT